MKVHGSSINVVGDVGDNASVLQIYAPGHGVLEAEVLLPARDAATFSPEWLQFFQDNVPLVGRRAELAALQSFLTADAPFLWWGVFGPAGIGKSRLAHALLKSLDGWEGGFLAADRSNVGATSAWLPKQQAIWVMDYAAARGDAVSEMLAVLARRFARSSAKVRMLLLERSAGSASPWWRGLVQRAGRNASLLRSTLHGEPLELPPLAAEASRMLADWLNAAGHPLEHAARKAAAVPADDLARATAGGRPLLVALVAAAIHQGNAQALHGSMPMDCIDDYLDRELRLIEAECGSKADFAHACHTLFFTTLMGGWTELVAGEPKALARLQQVVGAPDARRCLQVLSERGISARSHWTLRPDALGERYIEVMATRPASADGHYTALPPIDGPRLGLLVLHGLHGSRAYETLARLNDPTAMALLALAAQHTDASLRFVLIAMRLMAMKRGAALSSAFASLFRPELFGPRYRPEVAALVEAGYAYAEGRGMLDALTAAAALDPSRQAAVWLVPFMATIGAVDGRRLYDLSIWYASWFAKAKIERTRELVLALELLDRVAVDLIGRVPQEAPATSDGEAMIKGGLAPALSELYRRIGLQSQRILPKAAEEDARELILRLAHVGVQASYALLGGERYRDDPSRRQWLRAACEVATQGIAWAAWADDVRAAALCRRNEVAAAGLLDPRDPAPRKKRLALMGRCVDERRLSDWIDLAVDGLRINPGTGPSGPLLLVVEAVLRQPEWHAAAIPVLLAEDAPFLAALEAHLKAGQVEEALACAKTYGALMFAGPAVLENDTPFCWMMERIVTACGTACPDVLDDLVWNLESFFDVAAPYSSRSSAAAVLLANVFVNLSRTGAHPRFRVLSFELVPADNHGIVALRQASGIELGATRREEHAVRATCPALPDYVLDMLILGLDQESPPRRDGEPV